MIKYIKLVLKWLFIAWASVWAYMMLTGFGVMVVYDLSVGDNYYSYLQWYEWFYVWLVTPSVPIGILGYLLFVGWLFDNE